MLVALLAVHSGLGMANDRASASAREIELDCQATLDDVPVTWTVQLDVSLPLATVDSDDVPADYSAGHARLRLTPNGPALTIGLHSGRLLVANANGWVIGGGRCQKL
jgi:hypothetical protein